MKGFSFPTSRIDAIFGVDVSHHNAQNCGCQINWEKVADQKVAFVFAKASEGIRFRDPQFGAHWQTLGKISRIHRGAYHFLTADDDPEEQANYFLATIGPLQPNDLPPVLDLEWDTFDRASRKWPRRNNDYWSSLEPDEIIDRALKWLSTVEKTTGRIPIVYTSREWWIQRIKDESKVERLGRYGLWLASYANKDLQLEKPNANRKQGGKWTDWVLWQFTNMGDLSNAGIKNPSNPGTERWDVNIYGGTLDEFRKEMGLVSVVAVAPSPDSNKLSDINVPKQPGTGDAAPPPEPPKDKQAEVTPGPGGTRPDDSIAPKLPGSGEAAPPPEPPKDKQAAVTPGPDGSRPDDSVAPKPPVTGDAAPPPDPPKDTQAIVVPLPDGAKSGESSSPKTPGTGDATTPSERPKDSQMATVPTGDRATAEAPIKSPAGTLPQVSIIEIALANGRVLRVPQNIDPEVLARLVSVLERR